MLIGYARVSTDDQNLDLQRDALRIAGCEKIYEDRMSGAKAARPGLNRIEASRPPLFRQIRIPSTIGLAWVSTPESNRAHPEEFFR